MWWCLAAAAAACSAPAPADFSKGGRIHVAAIQVPNGSGDLASNQATIEKLVRVAAARGARYILLPEFYPGQLNIDPSLSLEQVRARGETLDGPIATHILGLCRELGVNVGFPLAERRADGRVYNSMVYAGPNGVEGVQSKAGLVNMVSPAEAAKPRRTVPWQEGEIFTPGSGNDGVFTWGGVRIGALICAEGGFARTYETRIKGGAQLICHASSSAGIKTGDNNPMPDAVARRYHRPVIFANHFPNYMAGEGNSQICDAAGNVVARAGAERDVVVDAVIELPPLPAD